MSGSALKPILLPDNYLDLNVTFDGLQREILKLMEVVTFDADNNPIVLGGLQNFANDVAAAAGGIPLTGLYRNGSVVMVRVS
jgi:hypothetical protein